MWELVAKNEQPDEHCAFDHTYSDAMLRVKLVEYPGHGSADATSNLKHRLRVEMAANRRRNVRVAVVLARFGIRIHSSLVVG